MTLDRIRKLATYCIGAAAAALTLAVSGAEYVLQGQFGAAALISVVSFLALASTFLLARMGASFRYMAVTVLMGQVMALLVATAGYPWQSDMHMAFFAALAICSLLYDTRAIVLGAGLIALHHLVVGMAFTDLVYFGGGGMGRFAL